MSSESESESEESFCAEEWIRLGVPEVLVKSLKENGFNNPTPIQKLTLPASMLGRKDIVGAAETGSGKTLAFALPILKGILENEGRALILSPTRELAVQIKNHIKAVAKNTKIRLAVIVGGLATQKQERLLSENPEIIIATPGRLWELIGSGNEYLSNLSQIKYLAVDETDRMVERGHFKELFGILGIVNSSPENKKLRQNFVFSATLSFTHDIPERMKNVNFKKKNKGQKRKRTKKQDSNEKLREIMEVIGVNEDAKIVDITSNKGTCEKLVEMQINCQLNQKDHFLYYFSMRHPGRTIVFCNSINCVRRITNLFFHLKCNSLPLHSEMVQKQRLKNLERFTADDNAILIATDVAARGLDINDIQHVIHYQVPKTAESYIHRSGRTARAFKGGLALIFIEPEESISFSNIWKNLGRSEVLPPFEIDWSIFRELKERVDLAIRLEKFEHSLKKKTADMNWFEKNRKEMDLASSSDDGDSDDGNGKKATKKNLKKGKNELENLKTKLNRLLASKPLVRSNYEIPVTLKKLAGIKKPALENNIQ